MSAVSRVLALLALVPLASCELYLRSDEATDGGGVDEPDSGALPDAFVPPDAPDIDAGPPPPPPNPGFVNPTQSTRANSFRNGAWQDVGPADWSCLAQPNEPVPANGYALSGTVRDSQSNGSVGGATITATVGGATIGSATSSTMQTTRGQYRLELPALPNGATRVRFDVATQTSRRTFTIDRYLGAFGTAMLDLPLMSEQTAAALPAVVGVTLDANGGLVVGEVRDCQGRAVSGAVVALSTVPNFVFHWPNSATYYYSAGNNQSLPVRHAVRTQTNSDGRFMIVGELPGTGEGFVQAYGYKTDAALAANQLEVLNKSAAVIDAHTTSIVLLGRPRGFLGVN